MFWTWLVFTQTLGYASGIYQKKKKKRKNEQRSSKNQGPNSIFTCTQVFSPVFSPFWTYCNLVGPERKYLGPTNFFSPPSQTINKSKGNKIFHKKLINDMTKRKNGSVKRLFNLYIISLCYCFVLRKCSIWLE